MRAKADVASGTAPSLPMRLKLVGAVKAKVLSELRLEQNGGLPISWRKNNVSNINSKADSILRRLTPSTTLLIREEAIYDASTLLDEGLWPKKMYEQLVDSITVYILEALDGKRLANATPTETGVYLGMQIFVRCGREEDIPRLLPFFDSKVQAWKKIAALSIIDRLFSAEPPRLEIHAALHQRLTTIADAVVHKDVIGLNAQTGALAASVVRAMLSCNHPDSLSYVQNIINLNANISRFIVIPFGDHVLKLWQKNAPESVATKRLEKALSLIPAAYVK